MKRSEFLRTSAQLACATCLALAHSPRATAADAPAPASPPPPTPIDEALKRAQADYQFTSNWVTDLMEAIDTQLAPADKLKLIDACGRGCFNRHKFKQDIAEAGKGDVDKLIAAYRKNYGIQREGDLVHIRYGGGKCYCPAARNRPARPNDLHCECTRSTHQTIFETALGRPIKSELVETVRRGGKTCHIVLHLS